MHHPNVAIIGTAGRGKAGKQLSAPLFDRMVQRARELVPGPVRLVSGGAAWADHVAVVLFLSDRVAYPQLTLLLPRPLVRNSVTGKYAYQETGSYDFRSNPGRASNYYHRQFSAKVGRDTLDEIGRAIQEGAKVEVFPGFFARNDAIVMSADSIFAFTFGAGDEPCDGGTRYTWDKSLCEQKTHVPLASLM